MTNDSSIFSIPTLKQWHLDMQDRYTPRYSPPTKSYSVQNDKRFLYANATTDDQSKTGLRRLNWVASHQQHQPTRNKAQLWATEFFELSYLSTKIICYKEGGLAKNLYRKLTTYAKDLTISRISSRLVDVWDDMILFCSNSNQQ